MKVYVVGFAPADDRAATGGFDWYPVEALDAARSRMAEYLDLAGKHSAAMDTHSLTFVPVDVPDEVAYAQPGGGGVEVDRDGITRWLEHESHLFEVSLPSRDENLLREGVALGRELQRRGEPITPAARAAVEALLEEPRQTRPSAILRRPDPETPVSEATTADLLFEARERMEAKTQTFQAILLSQVVEENRRRHDLARAVDAVEDAISLHNRAVYRERGIFAITDAERTPPAEPAIDRLAEARDVIASGLEAVRLTREYVGEESLPAVEGWSWHDWAGRAEAFLGVEKTAPTDYLVRVCLARCGFDASFQPAEVQACPSCGGALGSVPYSKVEAFLRGEFQP